MKIYLDTSSLFKLYYKEVGSEELEQIFAESEIEQIVLSEISIVEFHSTVWKKVRTKVLAKDQALKLIEIFDNDLVKYHFIPINKSLLLKAEELLLLYGEQGLRTLDSIQLATAVSVKSSLELAKTSDVLLEKLLVTEGIRCW